MVGLFSRRGGGSGLYRQRYDQRSMIPRYTVPPDRNTREWMESFGQNPRMAVVDRIASDMSFLAGKLFRVDKYGEEREILQHPFLDFWYNPNPLHEMSSSALWRLQQIYLDLKGEGYFIIERDVMGRPAELWPVPTHWVLMIPYQGHPYYSIKVASGAVFDMPVEDMFVMRELNPLDPYRRGLGKAEPLADEIETDEYAAKFQKKFFYNDATPNLLLSMPNSTEPQRRRFLAEWRERLQGVFKSHGVAAVNGDVSAIKLGESMKDLDMTNGRTFLRNAVLEHFGMPREIMGITESSNRATSEAAQFIYAQNVLTPRKNQREDAVNQQLLPYFGEDLVWRFDDIIPRNQEFDKAVAIEGWNSGLLTRNESRELLGQDAVENGDIYKTQFSDVFVTDKDDPVAVSDDMARLQFDDNYTEPEDPEGDVIEIAGAEIEIEDPPQKRVRSRRELKTKRVVGLQRTLASVRREQERRFNAVTLKYFKEQQERIGAALGLTQKADSSILDGLTLENLDDFIDRLLDWEAEESILEYFFRPYWHETYNKGADAAKSAYNISVKRPELSNFSKLHGAERVKEIQDTTKESIRSIVADGIEHGHSREKMAESIMKDANMGPGRARIIAQNEAHISMMTGNMDMMRAGGCKTKTWLTAGDRDVRSIHKKMHGETVPINQPFSNGLMFPGDPNCKDAKQIVGCRCDMVDGDFA